eukprot:2629030-Prymnesium_polylepis.1
MNQPASQPRAHSVRSGNPGRDCSGPPTPARTHGHTLTIRSRSHPHERRSSRSLEADNQRCHLACEGGSAACLVVAHECGFASEGVTFPPAGGASGAVLERGFQPGPPLRPPILRLVRTSPHADPRR